MKLPFISVIIPARNAEDTIENCIRSLTELDYPKDRMEVIIADGLSSDRTREIAEAYGAKVIVNPGKRVVSGRNVGFEAAQGQLIAFSDADCIMDPDWLRNCVKYFNDEKVAGVGGPNLVPDDESNFAKTTGLIFDCAFSVKGGAPTRVFNKVIESRTHGSNAIYRADVLRRVMPVDEDLIGGEDVVRDAKIKRLGYKLLYVPDVLVFHYRRATAKKWWDQMYLYGSGKARLGRKMRETVPLTQVGLGLAIPILVAFIALSAIFKPLALLAGIAAGIVVALLFAVMALVKTKSLPVALNMPLALLILAIAWSCGFLRELLFPTKSLG
jgi:cellulose synthase/poly-beta-1,6-N-acetylglucosamine synthase-like glycosyltransferase